MARKHRKGYYVDGKFVVTGSNAEAQAADDEQQVMAPSRTELKHASEKLQEIGEALLDLRSARLAGLSLPEQLHDAIMAAKRMTSHGALRRQRQFIGKLMRGLDETTLDAVREALRIEHGRSAADIQFMHRAEKWRDDLIADDERLAQWLSEYPATDVQHLRALIRQARKDAREATAGADEGRRHSRAYREIFAVVRSLLQSAAKAEQSV